VWEVLGSMEMSYCCVGQLVACWMTLWHDMTRHDTTRHDTTRHDCYHLGNLRTSSKVQRIMSYNATSCCYVSYANGKSLSHPRAIT
jgi:hypothetical protein